MAGNQKHYHYVPAAYLAGFTPLGTKDGYLYVRDLVQDKGWRARPDELAKQRDYYALDGIDGVNREALENVLATLESDVSPLLRELSDSPRELTKKDLERLLPFVAVQALRVPAWLNGVKEFYRRTTDLTARFAIASRERFEAIVERMKRDGIAGADEMDYDAIRRFLDERDYEIDVPRELVLARGLEHVIVVEELLAQRRWTLLHTGSPAADSSFITSDRPVILVATSADAPRHLGFGLRYTEVVMPLSRCACILGTWEEGSGVIEVPAEAIGLVNRRVTAAATRYVFAGWPSYRVTQLRDELTQPK